jgi:pSer/pThr/pTyr-binding forkhead associated (FHA) protein
MLPKGVYEALPWLYMAIGALTPALLASDLKYLPAILFFVTGVLVLMLRNSARTRLKRRLKASVGRSQPR